MSGLSRDAWLAALREVSETPLPASDAITVVEFAALLGCGRWTAARKIQKLVAVGKATKERKLIRREDGVVIWSPAYRLVKEKPDAGRTDGRRHAGRGGRDRSDAGTGRRTATHPTR